MPPLSLLFLFPLTIFLGDFIHFHSFIFCYMLMIYRCDFTSRIILLSYKSICVSFLLKNLCLDRIDSQISYSPLSILEFIIFHQICCSCVFFFFQGIAFLFFRLLKPSSGSAFFFFLPLPQACLKGPYSLCIS